MEITPSTSQFLIGYNIIGFIQIHKVLFRGDPDNNGRDDYVQRVESFLQRGLDPLLLNFGETTFVGRDDLVAGPVQAAAENQVVERVGEQILNEGNPAVLKVADVLPVEIFATLFYVINISLIITQSKR
jgi:hypothetical protein